jgi:3-oxoacyl-[acyl-carrier protein] reductase
LPEELGSQRKDILVDLAISGKRAAVAASSAGLGFATAQALANEGVHVAICSRDEARVNEAAKKIGPLATAIVADVATATGATRFIEQSIEALGGIDILVANGGGPPMGGFDATELDAYVTAFQANALTTIAMCKAAVPGMKERGWGRIVAITSVVAKQPAPYLILSNTARAGLQAFLKTTSLAVGEHGITVNSVMPGSHATDRIKHLYGDNPDLSAIPMRALGRPEDFGAAVTFLCSDQARYITGTAMVVDGGGYAGLW